MEKFEEVTKKGAKKKDVSAPASTVARAFPRGGDRAARDRSSPEGLHRDSPGRQPLTARLTFPVPSPRPQAPKPAPQGAKPALGARLAGKNDAIPDQWFGTVGIVGN